MHIEASQSCLCIVDMVCGARGGAGQKRDAQCNAYSSWLSWLLVFLGMGGGPFMSSAPLVHGQGVLGSLGDCAH